MLLPLTLLCIIIVNFVIINLAPGDPVSVTEISDSGNASRKESASDAFGSDERYLHFREHYGLTLPIIFNRWSSTPKEDVSRVIVQLITKKESPDDAEEMSIKDFSAIQTAFGDRARYVMPHLLDIIEGDGDIATKSIASRFFARGGSRQPFLGPGLPAKKKAYNKKISVDNNILRNAMISAADPSDVITEKISTMALWYEGNKESYVFEPDNISKAKILFIETRFARYLSRVLTLDFGTLRNDNNKKVIGEVSKRFKYSLTLAILPMLITFVLCQVFGCYMSIRQNRWQDITLNVMFLLLYATPIFVVAPFLIEKVALNNTFFFSDIAIPISGFNSSDSIYNTFTSSERFFDILQHICLPLLAVLYGTLAVQSRLSRTAVLEVLRQDYVRTAHAKGLSPLHVLIFHVGRNAAITIVTSVAGSLGIVLGGSLIIETIFGIDGFGRFFYEAVINRDYNVIMFSALMSSTLTLLGNLTADITYTLLDPRMSLEQ